MKGNKASTAKALPLYGSAIQSRANIYELKFTRGSLIQSVHERSPTVTSRFIL